MAKFLYYLPGRRSAEAADLVSLGLPHLKGGRTECLGMFGNGPDGKAPGVVVRVSFGSEPLPGTPLNYHPDTQEWEEAVEGKAWVGYERDRPPKPSDLLHPRGIGGHPVELYGGEKWLIPAARNASGVWLLPERIRVNARGELRYEPCPEHADIAKGMEAAWRYITGTSDLPYDAALKLCAALLGLNYAVGLPEISALGLITSRNLLDVCAAAADMPALRETIKAMEEDQSANRPFDTPATGSTGDGPTGLPPDTCPPDATSYFTPGSAEGGE